jgi:hypothetical protein
MRAVHMAVLRRDLEMTRLLLEFKADPNGGIWPKRDATAIVSKEFSPMPAPIATSYRKL